MGALKKYVTCIMTLFIPSTCVYNISGIMILYSYLIHTDVHFDVVFFSFSFFFFCCNAIRAWETKKEYILSYRKNYIDKFEWAASLFSRHDHFPDSGTSAFFGVFFVYSLPFVYSDFMWKIFFCGSWNENLLPILSSSKVN